MPTPDHPVTIVNWNEARTFCQAVGGRLPTEAEWEYAARGGRDGAVFPWGDQPPTDRTGSVNGVAFESDSPKPVRSFAPNGYGLYDMAGNVWEWVADWYARYEPGSPTDPPGPVSGQARAVRGGSYGDDDGNLVGLDAKSGKHLWNFNLGERLTASPMMYEADGKQYVLVSATQGGRAGGAGAQGRETAAAPAAEAPRAYVAFALP